MKYQLNYHTKFNQSLLFWLYKYIRFKMSTLSNRLVNNKEGFENILSNLRNDKEQSMVNLKRYSKDARNLGLSGINLFIIPLEKMYYFFERNDLEVLENIDEEILIEFLTSATSTLSDDSKKNYRNVLINFFKYIDKNNVFKNDVAYIFNIELKNWFSSSKKGKKLPSFMTEEEVKRFLDTLKYIDLGKSSIRDRCIIKLILFTGIRVSEALNLKKDQIYIDDDMYIIKIIGKGNIHRTVVIKQENIKQELLNVIECPCNDELLFCNKKGNRLTQAYISKIMKKILFEAKIHPDKKGPHMLRHTFGTALYKKNRDIVLVKEALGHANTDTSMIYTHFDKERLKAAANTFSD